VAGVKVLSKKLPRMEIYASAGTALYFKDVPELYSRIRVISEGETVELCGLTVMPFKTSHDALESFGYVICSEGKKLFGFATDTGCVTEDIYEALKGAKVCVLESNHDEGMLMCGPYPYYLKRRILSDRGHLSNTDCASLAESLYKDGTQRFVLAHLSAENNMPELAFETVKAAVRYADVSVAPRKDASEEFYA
jgi:phosphoribosyl 1,2-cyclic phosphodiesterase